MIERLTHLNSLAVKVNLPRRIVPRRMWFPRLLLCESNRIWSLQRTAIDDEILRDFEFRASQSGCLGKS